MLCTKASLWYAWYHSADTFLEGVFDKDDIEVLELRLEGGWLILASGSSRDLLFKNNNIFEHFHPDEDSAINWFTFRRSFLVGPPIIMRGSYTNISGRRCSRLCFGSSNDFIFCSTHSSTSLLRNKKRLPTKSWVSPFLHRYESLANNKNQCLDAKQFDFDDNQNKGVFSWNQRWLYTLRRFKHNCGCMIFMQAKLRVTTKTQSFCGEVPPSCAQQNTFRVVYQRC